MFLVYDVLSTSVGPQIDVTLQSVFASKKRNMVDDERLVQASSITPSNFQVYAKIDEESRKDNLLAVSFLVTLNEIKGSVTYEFRGACHITGSSADFEAIMGASKDSRVPKILDTIYQRLYPVVYMLAGMTTASFPQSVALLTEMISSEPVQVRQEMQQLPAPEEKPTKPAEPVAKTAEPKVAEAPKPTIAKVKKQLQQPSSSDAESGKVALAK